MTSIILQKALGQGWTQRALCGQGPVSLNKFVPGNWIENGTLPSWRLRVLKSAGWDLFDYNDERYLMPDPELASFALGTAYKDYLKVMEGRGEKVAAGPSRYAGAYNDLIDCILHNDCLEGQMPLASGATLLYPLSFDKIQPRENIKRRMRHALWGGWAMVNPITEGRDLFILPPEAIIKGKNVTPDDAQVSRGVLQQLHETGLVALRARGFGKSRIAPAVFSLPPRSAKGQTWANFVADQTARWRGVAVTPIVDFEKYSWLSDVPELVAYLQKYRPYVEHFDLLRIEQYLSAWCLTADFDVLEKMVDGIKGIIGEIAARQEIVDEYRSNSGVGNILVVAPQIFSGGDVLERSDAMVIRIDGETAVIEKLWEVTTEDDDAAVEDAMLQHKASVEAYRKGGVIFREVGGRVFKCKSAVLPRGAIETYAAAIRSDDKDMDVVLNSLRDHLVTMMEMDLVNSRVRNSFVPTLEELKEIIRDPRGVERLMELLGAQASADDGRVYMEGRVRSGGRVTGLRVIGAEEARNPVRSNFLLGFDPVDDGYVLHEVRGKSALNLALPFVESNLGRQLEAVEKQFLAGVLGATIRYGSKDERPMAEDLEGHLREQGINHLLELSRFVRAAISDSRIFVTGQLKKDGQVTGLRIISAEEVSNIGKASFLLGFDPVDEGYVLREARGKRVLDLALPIIESSFGDPLESVEKSFLAGVLGTRRKSGDKDERLMVKNLAEHLREHGIERFLKLTRLVGAEIPEGRIYVIGRVEWSSKVTGLRIVGVEGARELPKTCFLLGFDPADEGYVLREAKGTGAMDLALPFVESNLGRQLDVVKKTFLAGVLGAQLQSSDGDERLSAEDLTKHLREHGIEHLLELMRLLDAEIPEDRFYVTGRVQSSGQVVGLRIIGAEEAESVGNTSFLLGFDSVDEVYVLQEAIGKRALDLALPFIESNLGDPLESVEKSFLAGVLGTRRKSGDKDERLMVKNLAEHLREHGIERFLKLTRLVGAEIPEGRIYVTGYVPRSGRVTGLRIIGAERARELPINYFLLGFDPKDGTYHLDREGIRANPTVKKALLS